MDLNQLSVYFSTYKKLQQKLPYGPEAFNSLWIETVPAGGPEWSVEQLPILLSLIHPNFTYNRHGHPDRDRDYSTSRKTFSKKYTTERCQLSKLLADAIQCPYQRREVRCQADHLWPFSLGGPTIETNKLALCEDCNRQKSNSPFLYPGDRVPRWLVLRVMQLKRSKERLIV